MVVPLLHTVSVTRSQAPHTVTPVTAQDQETTRHNHAHNSPPAHRVFVERFRRARSRTSAGRDRGHTRHAAHARCRPSRLSGNCLAGTHTPLVCSCVITTTLSSVHRALAHRRPSRRSPSVHTPPCGGCAAVWRVRRRCVGLKQFCSCSPARGATAPRKGRPGSRWR